MSFAAATALRLSRYCCQYEVANVAFCRKDGILNNLIFPMIVLYMSKLREQARHGRGGVWLQPQCEVSVHD